MLKIVCIYETFHSNCTKIGNIYTNNSELENTICQMLMILVSFLFQKKFCLAKIRFQIQAKLWQQDFYVKSSELPLSIILI